MADTEREILELELAGERHDIEVTFRTFDALEQALGRNGDDIAERLQTGTLRYGALATLLHALVRGKSKLSRADIGEHVVSADQALIDYYCLFVYSILAMVRRAVPEHQWNELKDEVQGKAPSAAAASASNSTSSQSKDSAGSPANSGSADRARSAGRGKRTTRKGKSG